MVGILCLQGCIIETSTDLEQEGEGQLLPHLHEDCRHKFKFCVRPPN